MTITNPLIVTKIYDDNGDLIPKEDRPVGITQKLETVSVPRMIEVDDGQGGTVQQQVIGFEAIVYVSWFGDRVPCFTVEDRNALEWISFAEDFDLTDDDETEEDEIDAEDTTESTLTPRSTEPRSAELT